MLSANITAQNPANNDNPYDYAGRLHNDILSDILAEYKKSDININNVCDIVESKTKTNRELIDLGATNVDCDLLSQGIEDYTNQFSNLIETSKLSSSGKLKARIIINFMFDSAFSDKEISYQKLYNFYVSLENDIMNNNNLNDFDKKSLLEGCSIARYSTHYWKNNNESAKSSDPKRGFWGWLAIGAADVGGGLLAGISTGISASSLAHTLTDPDEK